MIEHDTVFIMGAGASVPYGYPTGKKLRHNIIYSSKGMLDNLIHKNSLVPNDLLSVYDSQINEFIDDFKRSATPSIDLFLSRNRKYEVIGKLAIAITILYAETKSKFVEDIDEKFQDWYSFLLDRMTNKLPKAEDYKRFSKNKVSFITFNYDRSFDYFLHDSLIHSFTEIDRDNSNFSEIIPFPIIHIYGSLSNLPWQEKNAYYYRKGKLDESIRDFEMIYSMSKNIRIIQDRIRSQEIENAKDLISKAQKVFFLGFGFADENLKVLGIPQLITSEHTVFATVLGFSEKRINDLRHHFRLNCGIESNQEKQAFIDASLHLEPIDCKDLLDKHL
jgi:hypothetical protein